MGLDVSVLSYGASESGASVYITVYLCGGECVREEVVQEGTVVVVLHHHPQLKPQVCDVKRETGKKETRVK